jgi:hypothetical protein
MFHLLIIAFVFGILVSGCGYKADPKYVNDVKTSEVQE